MFSISVETSAGKISASFDGKNILVLEYLLYSLENWCFPGSPLQTEFSWSWLIIQYGPNWYDCNGGILVWRKIIVLKKSSRWSTFGLVKQQLPTVVVGVKKVIEKTSSYLLSGTTLNYIIKLPKRCLLFFKHT